MKREQKETIRRIMCILTAATLLAGCIPMKVTAVEEGNLPHYLDESNRLDQEISGEDGLQEDDSDQGDSTKDNSYGEGFKEDITDENKSEKNDSEKDDFGTDDSTENGSTKEDSDKGDMDAGDSDGEDSDEEGSAMRNQRDQSRLAMFLVGMRELH